MRHHQQSYKNHHLFSKNSASQPALIEGHSQQSMVMEEGNPNAANRKIQAQLQYRGHQECSSEGEHQDGVDVDDDDDEVYDDQDGGQDSNCFVDVDE